MKKYFIFIAVSLFLVSGCKNFMTNNSEFADDMAREVSYATAPEVYVTVSEPSEGSTKYGSIVKGSRDVKVGFPFQIEYEITKEEGYFCYWEAFQNYDANKTNTPITDTEIIEFENASANPTNVTLKKEISNIRIIPKINKTPMVNIESPDYGTSTLSGLTKLLPDETVPVVFSSLDQYGFTALKVTSRNLTKDLVTSIDLRTMESFNEEVILKDNNGHNLFKLTNLRISSNLSSVSFILEAESGLADVYNISIDGSQRPQVDATSNVPSQTEGVMRTTPIKIKFTDEMNVSQITNENFNEYIKISRIVENQETLEETVYDCFKDSGNSDKKYFQVPEFLSDKKTLLVSPVNKLNESEWLPSGAKIRVDVSNKICSSSGIPLLNDYSFIFSLGTNGDAQGPILTESATSLSIKRNGESAYTEIGTSEWGDFEPSKNPEANKTYCDSIHVGPGTDFKINMQASDISTGDTGIKEFVAYVRLMFVSEGGRLPNSSGEAQKNLTLFDKDGNWLYETGFLKQDFYKEYSLSYSGANKTAEPEEDFTINFNDFITDETSGSLSVDGIYRIELTAKDALDNYSSNPKVYYVVRDTTPPDAEKSGDVLSISSNVINQNRNYFGNSNKNVKIIKNSDVFDFGTNGQPLIGSKKDKLKWRFAISESDVNCTSSWLEWNFVSPEKTLSIPEQYFSSSALDKILFVWVQFCDEFENISVPYCLKKEPLYIDVQKPENPIINTSLCELSVTKDKLFIPSDEIDIEWKITNISETNFASESFLIVIDENGKHIVNKNKFKFLNGKEYTVYSEDILGNKSNSISFIAEYDTSLPVVNITELKSDYEKTITGYINDDGKYHFSSKAVTIGSGSSFTYDISGYTAGGIILSFNVTKGGKGLTENGISVSGMKITNYQIGSNPSVSCTDAPLSYLPIQKGTLNDNTLYVLKGNLINPLDGSDDGEKTVSVSVSDGVHSSVIATKKIILDSTPPSLSISPIISSRCGYIYKNGVHNLIFRDYPQYKRQEFLLTAKNLGQDNDYNFDYSAYYEISDSGIGEKFIDSNYINLSDQGSLTQQKYYYEYNDNYYFYNTTLTNENNNRPLDFIFPNLNSSSIRLTELYDGLWGYSVRFEISDILGNTAEISKSCGRDIEGPYYYTYIDSNNSLNIYPSKKNDATINDDIYYCYVGENENLYVDIFDSTTKIKYVNITSTKGTEVVYNKTYYEDSVISLSDLNEGLGTLYKLEGMDIIGNTSQKYINVLKDVASPKITSFDACGYGANGLLSQKYYNKDILVKFKVEDNSRLTKIKYISNHKLKKYSTNNGSDWIEVNDTDNSDFFKLNNLSSYEAWFVFTPKDPKEPSNVILSFEDFFGNETIYKSTLKDDFFAPSISYIGTGNYTSSESKTGYEAYFNANKPLVTATFNKINEDPYARVYVKNNEIYIDSFYYYKASIGTKGNNYVEFRVKAYDNVNGEIHNYYTPTSDSESPLHVVLSGFTETTPVDNWYNFKIIPDCTKTYTLKLYDNIDNIVEYPVHFNKQEFSTFIDFTYIPKELIGDNWEIASATKANGSSDNVLKSSIEGKANTSCKKEITTLCNAISFQYKISTETYYDHFIFSIDGEPVIQRKEKTQEQATNTASGKVDWKTYNTPAGSNLELKEHTFTWEYIKDSSGNYNDDCIYLDTITFYLRN